MNQLTPISEYSFEAALHEFESIVDQLEKTVTVKLDNSIALYKHDVKLRKYCEKILAQAKLRIKKVVGTSPEGQPAEALAS